MKHLFWLLCLILVPPVCATGQPNIVIFMADDMGFSDAGAYGGEIDTPNIDSLAEAGMRFTQFYNAARCGPTRQALLTGLYPQQAATPNSVTLAEVLRSAGYRTLMTGKWDGIKGLPTQRGFDRFYGLISGSCNFFNPGNRRPGEPEPAKDFGEVRPFAIDGKIYKPYTPEDPNWYASDAFTDHALEYLSTYAGENRPFFLYVSFTAPHHPLQARPKDIKKYRHQYMKGWDKLRQERWERQQELGLADESWSLSPRDPAAKPWHEEKDQDGRDLEMAVYAAMVDNMDWNIGRVLKKLQEIGKSENTLVIFLSDNGASAEINNQTPDIPPGPMDSYRTYDLEWANASNTPYRKFKIDIYEGGTCTPFIVKWPGHIKPHSINRAPGHIMDIMPTLCDLAGIDYPDTLNGRSVLPTEGRSLIGLLQGKGRESHPQLFWEHLGNNAVREGDWKLVGTGDPSDLKIWHLFDLSKDRSEVVDLAGTQTDRVKRMAAAWIRWAERTGLHSEYSEKAK
jgi:arylsulfatase